MNDHVQASPSLQQLAERSGVAVRYYSFYGEDKAVPDEVLRKALTAMGVDPDAPAGAPETGLLAPVLVTDEGTPARVLLGAGAGRVRWQLSGEGGARSGESVAHEGGQAIELGADLAPGYHALRVDGTEAECLVIVAPPRCWVHPALAAGERWWGCTIQLYALRSSRNWGIGDFGDLRQLAVMLARQGGSFIGLSPLHALFPHRPQVASPYSPSSRNALNPLYIDVQSLPELAACRQAGALVDSEGFQQRLRELRDAEMVDYPGVLAAKDEVLSLLWPHFRRHELDARTPRGERFRAFAQERRETLGRHALFEALQAHLFAADADVWGWPAWPQAFKDPHGDCVAGFADKHGDAVQYRLWLQWLAEEQLEAAQRLARAHGMGLGLYCDLAVGVNEGGADTWSDPSMYALGMHIGAPPDPLATGGQDWGLPPLNPLRLAGGQFKPFIDTIRANMRHAGALRLDHVMGLMRLFWTGSEGGTYVRYPLEALLAILALESHRHRCMVIGEDLGNVAPEMRQAMHDKVLLSYKPLLFERNEDGSFRAPGQWQAQALAVVSTHDLPTLRGFWRGEDLQLQQRLGLYPNQESFDRAVIDRSRDRARLLLALEHQRLLPAGATVQDTSLPDATPALVEAVYAYLARTPCWLVGVQLEDVTGQLLQVNVPGTGEDTYPNWRRKIGVPVDRLGEDARFLAVAGALRQQRTGPAPMDAAALAPLDSALIPLSTYRVQFHAGCRFDDVAAAVPYLAALGISHLYSSPYLKARPGSTHGYDIVDHNEVNPEVGTEQEHERMCRALRRHGMGQMLDVVPNHMGVLETDNGWWLDVLEHGQASLHAETFDIEWHPAEPGMEGRVLLPVLGDHYGKVLDAGELQLKFDHEAGEFSLHYYAHRFPIDPRDTPAIFSAAPWPPAADDGERDAHAVVASLLDAFSNLPPRERTDAASRQRRHRDSGLHKRALARLVRSHGWLARWIDQCLLHLNGQPGDSASHDPLHALILRQAWRAADWRVASDDVNYRRFFDVNTLAGLRMERPDVFEATHRRVLRWLQDGHLAALRIDHPDGLSDPQQYFERLQSRYAAMATLTGGEPRALYLVVEKILADHEAMPAGWPVHGGTGYRFASLVNALFVDAQRAEEFDRAYRAFSGQDESFEEIVYRCKKLIVETALFSELDWLSGQLARISRADRRTCDFTRNRLRNALAEVAAAFPVYRTYLRPGEEATATDTRHIDWAIAAAGRRLGGAESAVLDHLRKVLLGELPVEPALRDRFVARWQQFTAPVMAKSVEDTAFYRYLRLASLNDVGGDPGRFGLSVAAFHAANQSRSRFRPHGMLATSTHDSKRSEDLRARIDVLSELPGVWLERAGRWADMAQRYVTRTDAGDAPSRNDLWLLFQTLAGVWPAQPPAAEAVDALRERVQAYMLKAVREAKCRTSWTSPDQPYETALRDCIAGLLRSGGPNPFLTDLQEFAAQIAPFGLHNSMSQLALKFTVPGMPDLYQGCEEWNFRLVDPDNRAPVDFARLAAQLQALQPLYAQGHPRAAHWQELQRSVGDNRLKQLLTWRLLQLRRSRKLLLQHGAYLPVPAEGEAAQHVAAFARSRDSDALLVVASRLTYTLCGGETGRWGGTAWSGTLLRIGADQPALNRIGAWRDWITGRSVPATAQADGSATLDLSQVFAGNGHAPLPFAVLLPDDEVPAP
ncbi:malto-oligosyltrehalose synthase [Caenimonas terrae]|uniref:4-alpha-glucanotransferase n=1 Tax=Caenimonas terrae TaxID=696074 RepID=A0ABW0NB96_9BURK